MTAFLVLGEQIQAPYDVTVRTFATNHVPRFAPRGTRTRATEIIVHESVCCSVDSTIDLLQERGLSVHLILGPDGLLTQHADLASDILWHGGPVHNGSSFGVEVVNPYYPQLRRDGLPWQRVIKAPWAHQGQYVLPTPEQAEATASLVRWATSAPAPGIEVPRRWPGLRNGTFRLGRIAQAQKPLPGVLAHHYFNHADGAWLVFYAWLRIEIGLSKDLAFEEAARRATGVQHAARVRDLLPITPVA